MIKYKDILKNTPDYEPYSQNEVKLTISEMRELGLLKCGGCCSGENNKKCSGCGSGKKCCNKR